MTTIEKLAKALYDLEPIEQQETDVDWRPVGPAYMLTWEQASHDESVVEHYSDQARAVVTALRDEFADPVVRNAIQAALDEG